MLTLHRHKFGKWWQETRDRIAEHESYNDISKETVNLRQCACGFLQEKKATVY